MEHFGRIQVPEEAILGPVGAKFRSGIADFNTFDIVYSKFQDISPIVVQIDRLSTASSVMYESGIG